MGNKSSTTQYRTCSSCDGPYIHTNQLRERPIAQRKLCTTCFDRLNDPNLTDDQRIFLQAEQMEIRRG